MLFVYLFLAPKSSLIRNIDNQFSDYMFRIRGPQPTSGKVVIVDIDEESLKNYGQWPWPRDLTGKLIKKIGEQKPQVIGLDILFAEKDRTSPKDPRYTEIFSKVSGKEIKIPKEYDSDRKLTEALHDNPVITSFFLKSRNDNLESDNRPLPAFSVSLEDMIAANNGVNPFAPEGTAYNTLCNIPEVSESALSEGYFNSQIDSDGVIRFSQLLTPVTTHKMIYPSLALEMVNEGTNKQAKLILNSDQYPAIEINNHTLTLERNFRMRLNYRGPAMSFPYISASDVLQGKIPQSTFKGRYVLIGTSAVGLGDIRTTPFSPVVPGVEIHATAVDNLLLGDPVRLSHLAYIPIIMIFGFIISLIHTHCSRMKSFLLIITVIITVFELNYLIFKHGNICILSTFSLILTLIIIYSVTSVFKSILQPEKTPDLSGIYETGVNES